MNDSVCSRNRVGPRQSRRLQTQLLLALAKRAQPQRIETDEACGIAMVVGDRAFFEGDEILIVERIGALAADHRNAALVELEPYAAGDVGLRVIDRGLQHLA